MIVCFITIDISLIFFLCLLIIEQGNYLFIKKDFIPKTEIWNQISTVLDAVCPTVASYFRNVLSSDLLHLPSPIIFWFYCYLKYKLGKDVVLFVSIANLVIFYYHQLMRGKGWSSVSDNVIERKCHVISFCRVMGKSENTCPAWESA